MMNAMAHRIPEDYPNYVWHFILLFIRYRSTIFVLQHGDYNVIIVGWGDGSQTIDYPWAVANTRVVGSYTGVISQNLITNGGITANNIYCVGHSLGAHTCGHLGKWLRIGRITGNISHKINCKHFV